MSRGLEPRRTFQKQEEFDQLGEIKLWANRTTDGSRSDLDFRPLPGVWDAVQSENGNCLGRDCPRNKECFYFQARRRVWSANLLIVNHALFVTDLALRAAGFGMLPKYDVAIFDEAHTLEAVAGEHMGLQVSNIGVDITLARLYNDRSGKGLLSFHRLQEAMDQVQNARMAADDFFEQVAQWHLRHGQNFNGRVRRPLDWPDTLCEELHKLATAIGEGCGQGREARAPHRADRRAGPVQRPGRPDRELDRAVRRRPGLLGRARGTRRGCESAWPRLPSTWARACASCSSTRFRPAF